MLSISRLFGKTVSCIFVTCFLFCGFCHAAPLLDLSITNDKVVIKADHIALKDILQAISRETGMQVNLLAPETTEMIACRIDEPSLENALSNLLKNWNYVLSFSEEAGPANPELLWLVGKVSHQPHSMDMQTSAETGVRRDEHIQQLKKNVYTGLFKNKQIHAQQIKVTKGEHFSGQSDNVSLFPYPEQRGIRITALPSDSPFKKIGLHIGDTLYDVNGLPVNSVQDLVDALKTASSGHSIVRIERYRNDQTIDPIYLELH